jgi:hypothetical protein
VNSHVYRKPPSRLNDHVLSIKDVIVKRDSMDVIIRFSKTDKKGTSATLQVAKSGNGSTMCPVSAMQTYLSARPVREGPLFTHFSGSLLTRFQFHSILKKGITMIGLDSKEYSPHSFRIGAAKAAAIGGISIEAIKRMGRWRSSAVMLYIRPQRIIQSSEWGKNV